jgi:V/A-type H+-transporting ATPase subunit B
MDVGDAFEQNVLSQGVDENRVLEETLGLEWKTASILPKGELTKVKDKFIDQYYKAI